MHGKEPLNEPITLVSWQFVKSRFHCIKKRNIAALFVVPCYGLEAIDL